MEGETIGLGIGSNVGEDLDLTTAKHDQISFKTAVATRDKSLRRGFLQDAEDPFTRMVNGVVSDRGPVHTHEGDWGLAANKRAAFDGDIAGFVFGTQGSKELQSRGTADVDRPGSGIKELAAAYHDVAGATFRLWAGRLRESLLAAKRAVFNQTPMAAHHVDGPKNTRTTAKTARKPALT